MCIYRIPRNESIIKPRSRCPRCGHPIAWYDNIPIISWLALRAKCRHCAASISWQYPLVETITGILFFLIYWRFGLVPATPIYIALAAGLVLVTFVDLTNWTIPDEVTIPGIPIAMLCSILATFYPESGLRVMGPMSPVFNALIGVEIGGGLIWLLDKVARLLLKKRGMGFGDVKLLAMLGGFFGFVGGFLIIMIASVIGSVIGIITILIVSKKQSTEAEEQEEGEEVTLGGFLGMPGTILITTTALFIGSVVGGISRLVGKQKEIEPVEDWEQERQEEFTLAGHYLPFGPYLCLAGLIVMFFGPEIVDGYLTYLGPGM